MSIAKTTLRYVLFVTLMVLSVSCDQGTKLWARDALPGRTIRTVIGLGLLVMMFFWVRKSVKQGSLACASLGLIAGGAIGNLWDRIVMGSVTDFVYWKHGSCAP